MKKQFYSLTELAAKLKVTRQRVQQWVDEGRIPTQRIGSQHVVTAADAKRPKAKPRGPRPKKTVDKTP